MKLTLNIKMDSDAFSGQNGSECARILQELSVEMESQNLEPSCSGKLHDVNGNFVGQWKVTGGSR